MGARGGPRTTRAHPNFEPSGRGGEVVRSVRRDAWCPRGARGRRASAFCWRARRCDPSGNPSKRSRSPVVTHEPARRPAPARGDRHRRTRISSSGLSAPSARSTSSSKPRPPLSSFLVVGSSDSARTSLRHRLDHRGLVGVGGSTDVVDVPDVVVAIVVVIFVILVRSRPSSCGVSSMALSSFGRRKCSSPSPARPTFKVTMKTS